MDKKLDFSGIDPDLRLDQIMIDANANRPAMFAMMASLAVGTNPNYIIDGCVVVVGGASPANTWSLSAGYIYLNDEILQVESQSGAFDSATEFLAFSKSVTYDVRGDKTYQDGTPRQTWQKNRGVITVQGSVAVNELDAISGDHIDDKLKTYIGTSTTTSEGVTEKATTTEARNGTAEKNITADLIQGILKASNAEVAAGTVTDKFATPAGIAFKDDGLKWSFADLGDWDMDANASPVAQPTNPAGDKNLVKFVQVWIREDTTFGNRDLTQAGTIIVSNATIDLNRTPSGTFDSVNYNSTSYNRGFIMIGYK